MALWSLSSQFLCSSATIKDPAELATALTGKPVEWIQESGAPRGERYFAIYNPPVVNWHLGKSEVGAGLEPV